MVATAICGLTSLSTHQRTCTKSTNTKPTCTRRVNRAMLLHGEKHPAHNDSIIVGPSRVNHKCSIAESDLVHTPRGGAKGKQIPARPIPVVRCAECPSKDPNREKTVKCSNIILRSRTNSPALASSLH